VDGWVERWLQTLPVEDVHREVAQLEVRIAELQAEIDKRRELLAMRQRWLDGGAPEAHAPEPTAEAPQTPAPDAEPATPERPTRADALLRLLAEDPERTWKLSHLRTELVARGWLEDTREASASLQVTASKLTRAGRIARPKAGRYRAAEPGEAAA
jgi:Tfp pilus assembly protein FimV